MSNEIKRIMTENIRRVLLKNHGWIEIVPGSFEFCTLEFHTTLPDETTSFTGLNYMGYIFRDNTSNYLYTVTTDNVGGLEVDEGGGN
jgi:hypothetical protein